MQAFLFAPWNQAKLQNVDVETVDPNRDRDMGFKGDQGDTDSTVTDSNSILSKSLFISRNIRFKIMNPNYTANAIDKSVNIGTPRILDFTLKGLNLPVIEKSASGLPSVDSPTLKKLLTSWVRNKNRKVKYFYDAELDQWSLSRIKKLDQFLSNVTEVKAIETLVNTFILTLQEVVDKDSRCHSSLNLLTETGRLSSRKPNLQNQPSADKDR